METTEMAEMVGITGAARCAGRRQNPLKELTKTACFSVTGSDPVVLQACMRDAKERGGWFICEATVNQVNQFGGYTGMKPKDYADMVCRLAREIGFPEEKVILSGDHLGPFTWQHLEAEEALRATLECFRQAFLESGLNQVWEDTVAVVALIGLEFSEDNVYDFNHENALPLARELERHPGICFESHSSDYQTPDALCHMVLDGVGILKVGPELTFAHREALFALAFIEEQLAPACGLAPSGFISVLDRTMRCSKPDYWRKYYHGSEDELRMKRGYSYSDRCRYYFEQPAVKKAREKLIENLSSVKIPTYLLSQFMPVQYEKVRMGLLQNTPEALIDDKIRAVMDRYYQSMLSGLKQKGCIGREAV